MSKMKWDLENINKRDRRRSSDWVRYDDYFPSVLSPSRRSTNAAVVTRGNTANKQSTLPQTNARRPPSTVIPTKKYSTAQQSKPPIRVSIVQTPRKPLSSPSRTIKLKARANTLGSPKTQSTQFPVQTKAVKANMSGESIQKLAIRLFKAVGAQQMQQAAELASEIYGECMHQAEVGKKLGISKKF